MRSELNCHGPITACDTKNYVFNKHLSALEGQAVIGGHDNWASVGASQITAAIVTHALKPSLDLIILKFAPTL